MQGVLFLGKIINNLYNNKKGKKNCYKAWRYLFTISLQGMGNVQGLSTKISGESEVISKIISEGNEIVIIDVGANKGQYTDLILEHKFNSKHGEIHLFEPSFTNIKMLSEKFINVSDSPVKFIINDCALSDINSSAFLYTDSEGSDLGSLYNLKIPLRPFDENKKETITTKTLDEYANEKNIRQIDLLKIDVEGAEFNVIRGAQQLIKEKRIKNIQFEFGPGNISSRIFFNDFWNLLSPLYNFFQIISDGFIPVEKYSVDKEIFITVNYFLSLK